jgi:hypothetical protein
MIYVLFTENKFYKFLVLADTRIDSDISRGVTLECEPAVNGTTGHAYDCKLRWWQSIRLLFLFTWRVMSWWSSSLNVDVLQEIRVYICFLACFNYQFN